MKLNFTNQINQSWAFLDWTYKVYENQRKKCLFDLINDKKWNTPSLRKNYPLKKKIINNK